MAIDSTSIPPAGRRSALENRFFRDLLLAITGVPIGVMYAWQTLGMVLVPVAPPPNDFGHVYLTAARALAAGKDPYQACAAGACLAGRFDAETYYYPPVVAWMMQPLAHLGDRAAEIGAMVAVQIMIAIFIWSVVRALGWRDRQFWVLATIAVLSFPATLVEVQNMNLQILLLAASGVWLLGWVAGDVWWAGAALGIAMAIKLIQAPLYALTLWGRSWVMAISAAAVFAILWLIAVPRLLPEYIFQVLPGVGMVGGQEMNITPLAGLARLLHPESLYGRGSGVDGVVLAGAVLVAVVVVAVTIVMVGRAGTTGELRALQAAAVVAASPFLTTSAWDGHLVLVLLSMIVVAAAALRRRDHLLLAAVAVSWLLIGPVYLAFTNVFAAGIGPTIIVRLGAESALAGALILWLATLRALAVFRREQATPGRA